MKTVKVVIGSQYGDEGKGLITDYLSSLHSTSQVVRFNGGAQASHSVVHDGTRHAFRHCGSNSFLPSSSTYLSKHFILNSFVYESEIAELRAKGITPTIIVHPDCMVTTVFDIAINQLLEIKRGQSKHGSCGLGINQTVTRSLNMSNPLTFQDIWYPDDLKVKLADIQHNWFIPQLKLLELTVPSYMEFLLDGNTIEIEASKLLQSFGGMLANTMVPEHPHIIFEGAQGLLLSEKWCPITPYVTRSFTGIKNVLDVTDPTDTHYDVYYVSRCYSTRHGAGPLPHEVDGLIYSNIDDPNNVYNLHQGSIRYGVLDLDLLFSAIEDDAQQLKQYNHTINVAITCLDQTHNVRFYHNGVHTVMSRLKFIQYVQQCIKDNGWNNMLVSFGPSREFVENFNGI